MNKYIINVSFQTRVNKTTRTLEIAESFGLGLDEKEWTLYDNLELEVKQGDVVYITGQSGSGKSVVLRELQRQMKDEGLSVASIDDFTFDNEVNVICPECSCTRLSEDGIAIIRPPLHFHHLSHQIRLELLLPTSQAIRHR